MLENNYQHLLLSQRELVIRSDCDMESCQKCIVVTEASVR